MALKNQIGVASSVARLIESFKDLADLALEGAAVRIRVASPSNAILSAGRSAGDLDVLFGCST